MRKVYVLLFSTFFLFSASWAQQKEPVLLNIAVSDADIDRFINELSAKAGYNFYYDVKLFDTLRINVSARNEHLEKILERAFYNTDFSFSIDQQKNVFITKGKPIRTELPAGFFGRKKNTSDSTQNSIADPQEGDSTAEPTGTRLENKLYEIGRQTNDSKSTKATIAGVVRDDKTGEALPGVSVFVEGQDAIGIATDQSGFYSLTLPKGRHTLNIQSRGKEDTRRHILLHSDGKLDVDLHDRIISLRSVTISSRKSTNVSNVQLGVERLNIKAIKQTPTVFGEADILKVVLTLPGVKSVGEAGTGFNVRGGAVDQNLILFNGATIYNPAHFFGFFSTFNPEVVQDVQLYKSSIPPKYGGRLSSVLDITSREGNKKKIAGSAGIGVVTSRVNIEGPLFGDSTSSFVLGGRATYANWLLNLLPKEYKNSKASFYDITLHTAHEFNKRNYLHLTGYLSNDRFNLNSDTVYGYGNKNIVLQWKHTYNNKLTSIVSGGFDHYNYNISSDANKINAYRLQFDINQTHLKADFNYYLNAKHTVEFGAGSLLYKLHPGSYRPLGEESLTKPVTVAPEQAHESAVYIGDRYNITRKLSVNLGLRYSLYQYLGEQTVYEYAPGLPRKEDNRIDEKTYSKGDAINTYHGPEYRLAIRYAFSPVFSVKAGYNSLRQYIHMLSNTTAMAPTDIWKLSDPNIRPQTGDQFSFGLFKNFKSNTIETSIEVYYKRLENYLDYKSGAVLVLNHNIETDVINTEGKAYGLEVMVRKVVGKVNGWVSYTYARTLLKMDDPIAGELINRGEYYPSNYDKPHDFTLVGNIKISHRFSVSSNITYSTGRPITLPVAMYYYANGQRVHYSDRNSYRIPDYFRMDLSMNIEGNHRVHQKTHNSWTVGIYNLTGRKNPYSVYFVTENGRVNGYKLSIFGSLIPFVNFNIRF
ncbi:MAG TPA: carboxypeptidase-like regulatory domain-containing protein [Flavitalea sp.]|nr:carboxypeptidase-like regulatory domain-containing protein [Flavitalea sp.]